MNANNRTAERMRSLLGARVVFNNRASMIECMARDISTVGAKLVFALPTVVPDEFDLEIPQRGQTVRVRVIWRRDARCGVSFDTLQGPQPRA